MVPPLAAGRSPTEEIVEKRTLDTVYFTLPTQAKSYKNLSQPTKIYLDNPNLMYVLTTNINIGTVRETFFLNQLSVHHNVLFPNMGDFHVDQRYLFEVGGRSKSFEQIKDVPSRFLVVDGTEIGHHNRIPLWVFGLLY